MNPSASILEQALALTRSMLDAARAADWDRLIRLEAERHPLVMRQHALDGDEHQRLGEILAYDRELHALITAARDRVAEQWQLENGRAQAIAAYGG
jgi:hypothetical protein